MNWILLIVIFFMAWKLDEAELDELVNEDS